MSRFMFPLLLIMFLVSTLHADFFMVEEWFDKNDKAFYVFSDIHVSNVGVSYKQRYDFIRWAYKLDAACQLEDAFFDFCNYGQEFNKFCLNATTLLGLSKYCNDLKIPVKNVDFRTMRFALSNYPIFRLYFSSITGKQILSLTYNAIKEIKKYDDGELANKAYRDEIEAYEKLMSEHKGFFDYLDQDVSFAQLIQTINPELYVNLAHTINKVYFNSSTEYPNPEAIKIPMLILFDFPLLELQLLHHALNQEKKVGFIAAGFTHISRLSQFFTAVGFKRGRTIGSSTTSTTPIDIEEVFTNWNLPATRSEPSHYSLKLLKGRMALERTCVNPYVGLIMDYSTTAALAGSCYWGAKKIRRSLGYQPSRIKEGLIGLGVYSALETCLSLTSRRRAYKEHMQRFGVS